MFCPECGVLTEEGSVQREACVIEIQHCPECGIDFEVKYYATGEITISYGSKVLEAR